ncbi:MAG: TIGR00268 family protein, partial [Planctomycetota bacterium]|nr:TIGR00268 family protein [Planctomycetota bacterium]
LGLEVWDKPASACLASRIPVGTRVTADLLAQVERAEAGLRELGLRELRVRHKGAQARLELGEEDWKRGRGMKSQIEARLASSGFERVEWARYVPGHLRTAKV